MATGPNKDTGLVQTVSLTMRKEALSQPKGKSARFATNTSKHRCVGKKVHATVAADSKDLPTYLENQFFVEMLERD